MLIETLSQIKDSMKDNGEFICNYPQTPRKMLLTSKEIERIIIKVFGSVERVGGIRSAPIWKVIK